MVGCGRQERGLSGPRMSHLSQSQDPDNGSFNCGTYRNQVYDAKTIGCQITEGKHGRIHRDKYYERGEECKFVILVGEDPLLYMLSSSPLPEGVFPVAAKEIARAQHPGDECM